MSVSVSLGRFLGALRHRDYAIFSAGSTLSLIGLWMQRIAIGWVTWKLTGSATWLGIVAFCDLFPVMVISPFAGVLADRIDRLKIARVAQLLNMLQAAVLAALTLTGHLTIESLIACVLFGGIVISFWQPARMALIPAMVPREDLSSAVAINAVIFNAARFIGPALAGVVIVAYGAGWAFAANAVSYVPFQIGLYMMRSRPGAPRQRKGFGADMLEGYRYAFGHPGIGPMLLIMCVTCLALRPVMELLPAYSAEVFGRGADGLSMMATSTGIGAVIGGIYVGQRNGIGGLSFVAIVSVVLMVASYLGFALTDNFWLALVLLAAAGGGMVVNGAATQTLIQHAVGEDMRGRVLALYGMLFRAFPAMGALAMGSASEAVGLDWPLIAGCALSFGVWIWVMLRRRRISQALEGGPN